MDPGKETSPFTVFLCHASEDKPQVRELYKRLTDDGIDVWFDEQRLLPGQNWELEISRALRNARAIIVCLSKCSVRKESFLQKEIKIAFALAEEKPDGEIFILPVLLDDCPVPERFYTIHCVSAHKTDGYEKIIAALEKRAASLGLDLVSVEKQKRRKLDYLPTEDELSMLLKTMLRGTADLQEELEYLSQREPEGNGWLHKKIRSELLSIMSNPSRPPAERARVGDVLAAVGDPRFSREAWFLPDDDLLGFIEIPAGAFLMGNPAPSSRQEERESLLHEVILPTFYISRYPVTVAQYQAFLQATGRESEVKTWDGIPNNHPVTSVSWIKALRYCGWLTENLYKQPVVSRNIAQILEKQPGNGFSWLVSLPSEAEWEKAARGILDTRIYPWGIQPDPKRANYKETRLGRTSSVGCFNNGNSPYGISDLSGNVCEWTRSNWGSDISRPKFSYPYDPLDGREDIQDIYIQKVCRGGSFYASAEDIRCSSRCAAQPNSSYHHFGFRLALTLLMRQ